MNFLARSTRLLFVLSALGATPPGRAAERIVEIDAAAPTRPFPHVWETVMGSGRAALTLRAAWRRDLRAVKRITGLQYVRFHAILHDELGIYDEDAQGRPKYNFQYVDQVYDGLLAEGVKPMVELSFMPRKLAARPDTHIFWYHPIVSPPKSYAKWEALILELARHLITRYGIDEVSRWYFEVWNEPNLDFWTGKPAQRTYFELYDHTARALKAADPRLRVGGPSTASAEWVNDLIAHASRERVPLDFISTHIYGDDPVEPVLGPGRTAPPTGMACPAMRKVRGQIAGSAHPGLPLFFTETNISYGYLNPVLQGLAVGTWLAETVANCADAVDALALWTVSDVFEEQGVMPHPFAAGFGIIAQDGIPKPAFVAFSLLHKLGTQRIDTPSAEMIATKRDDGTLAVLAWHRALPGTAPKAATLELRFRALLPPVAASITRLDEQHADTLLLYKQMGAPTYPLQRQLAELRTAASRNPPEKRTLPDGVLRLQLSADAMALVEVTGAAAASEHKHRAAAP